jgi:hypothetical protein
VLTVKVSQEKERTLTRKDFQLIADVVKTIDNKDTRQHVALTFAHRLQGTNPNFNVTRFVDACAPVGS